MRNPRWDCDHLARSDSDCLFAEGKEKFSLYNRRDLLSFMCMRFETCLRLHLEIGQHGAGQTDSPHASTGHVLPKRQQVPGQVQSAAVQASHHTHRRGSTEGAKLGGALHARRHAFAQTD